MSAAIVDAGCRRMSRAEARDTLGRIREGLRDCRLLLLDLYEREGWRALGYSSWRECAAAEFDLSLRHLYRLLAAAQIERDVTHGSHPAGEAPIPERQLRELSRIDAKAMRIQIWDEACQLDGGRAQALRQLVDQAVAGGEVLDVKRSPGPSSATPPAADPSPLPPAADLIAAKIRAKAQALRPLHSHLGPRAREADQALDAYLAVAGC